MARPKKEKAIDLDAELEKQISKDIHEVTYYYFTKYKGGLPDVSHYGANFKLISKLFKSEDETARTYTLEDLKKVIDTLMQEDVAILSFTIFSYPDLVRSIVDDDQQSMRYVIGILRSQQQQKGFYGAKTLGSKPPSGW